MNKFKIEIVDDITLRDCSDIRNLIGKVPQNIKMHINDFCGYLTFGNKLHAAIVYSDDRLVGASLFFIKNRNTKNSTISLYNIFSLEKGVGTIALNEYWEYAIKHNVVWFKFYADLGAYEFYKKFGFKYFGVSKSGMTLSTMGRILDADIRKSNELWVPDDDAYLIKNVKVFMEKDTFGRNKIPKKYKHILLESPFHEFKIEPNSLEEYFI